MTKVLISSVLDAAPRRPSGYADAIYAAGTLHRDPIDGEYLDIPDEDYLALSEKYKAYGPSSLMPPCGPGCQLTKTFSWLGIRDDGRCGCAEYAAELDAKGPDWCEANIDAVVARLLEAAEKRGGLIAAGAALLPGAAVLAVRNAIAAARADLAGR